MGKAQGADVPAALAKLNPIIRGWANDFRSAVAKEIFNTLDDWMFYKAHRYAAHTHPKQSKDWRRRKYLGQLNLDRDDHWVFGDKQTGAYLLKLSWFPIERHVLVKGTSSRPSMTPTWQTTG
jgi:RNA-directed DNA polymerase